MKSAARKPWPSGYPKNMTAEQRVVRARNAALARTTAEHHIAALNGKVLTVEQRRLLANLLAEQSSPDGAS